MATKSTFKETAATIKELAEILDDTGLTEIEYEVGDARIRVSRQQGAGAPMMMAAPATIPSSAPQAAGNVVPTAAPAEESWETHPGTVKSPMVGTVYHSPSPDAAPFIQVGDSTNEGQTLMIIEAMKVMNPLKAKKSGVVKKILVENNHPVEYDQPLLVIA